MNFWIGCAVWAYKDWVGDLFPSGSKPSDFLSLYSRRFTAVEGNTTFYSIPDRATVARWAAETPDGFEFCPKLPRTITHEGKLAANLPAAIAFLELMRGLGDRLGPVFAQLPPSYGPDRLDDLATFLQGWPHQDAPLAVEVRHLDWFKDPHASQLNARLQKLGVGRVLLDTRPIYDCPDDPQVHSERRKPQVPLDLSVTADFSLIRFISHPEQAFNQPYLDGWVKQVAQWLQQGKRLYFFVHCPVEARSPGHARYVQQLLEEHSVAVPLLPWNGLEQPPSQLTLF
jgi:uncharacterized protein YecE (DUF72 family)